VVWMFVHLISLLGFRNKVIVFISWIGSYISYNGGSRLIIRRFVKEAVPPEAEPLPNSD
jgi:NADH:ubiquinone reductase (H+-translocating)